jgi:hypothetical protein
MPFVAIIVCVGVTDHHSPGLNQCWHVVVELSGGGSVEIKELTKKRGSYAPTNDCSKSDGIVLPGIGIRLCRRQSQS